METLVCISHLRWDFVWQRPQHLLGRLAKDYRVIFVEEPVTSTTHKQPSLHVSPGAKAENVTIVRLVQPAERDHWIGHGDPRTQKIYEMLLTEWLEAEGVCAPILWLYTPMAQDFIDAVPHSALVFDAMDQLSAFAGAPPELIAREKSVLARADVVFTGGISLYESKLAFNPNTWLFPSGVEVEHFARAARPNKLEIPADIANIAAPILGYFGVIDERLDLALLDALATAHPDWQIVMIGPVVKIDPASLPRRANIHTLGGKDYAQLPAYLARFDVALLPFALNEATRYISPTKTLEYMAAHKPIVSTAIRDVIASYGSVVRVALDHAAFVREVEQALQEDRGVNSPQRTKEEALLAANTWDSIARRMKEVIREVDTTVRV
jgi:UDP-galactopyranose mutase